MKHTARWKQRILSFIFDNNASSSLLGTCCQANVGFAHFHLACLKRQIHMNVGVARFLKDDNLRSRAVESACRGAGKNETTTGKCELRLAWNRHFKQNSESAD
jgi:hypothetical protein